MGNETFDKFIAGIYKFFDKALDRFGLEIWLQTAKTYGEDNVRLALAAHMADPERGRFMPKPADVVAQFLRKAESDGRPGPEEAWAMIPRTDDESCVWTSEMAEAFGIASRLTDSVAARMAFKEAYERLVREARADGKPVAWTPSLGSYLPGREKALKDAMARGRIDYETAVSLEPALEPPEHLQQRLIEDGRVPSEAGRQRVREMLRGLRDKVVVHRDVTRPMAAMEALRDREAAGETLTEFQRNAWREALAKRPSGQHGSGEFTPIPDECLPPGMRKKAKPVLVESAMQPTPWDEA